MRDQKQERKTGGFTRFKRNGGHNPSAPTVSIHSTGNLRMPTTLLDELGNPTHVALFYNREQQLLAIGPTLPSDPDGYRARFANGSILVSAKAMLGRLGLRGPEYQRRYPASVEDGRIVVALCAAETAP